jgi:hypothetical protein
MSLASSFNRLAEYFKRHGLAATFGRAGVAVRRSLFASRMVVFYCDLDDREPCRVSVPETFKIERVQSQSELRAEHFQQITSFWNPKLASRNIRERFGKGASLWLVDCEG